MFSTVKSMRSTGLKDEQPTCPDPFKYNLLASQNRVLRRVFLPKTNLRFAKVWEAFGKKHLPLKPPPAKAL